jgi:hypothetical protein
LGAAGAETLCAGVASDIPAAGRSTSPLEAMTATLLRVSLTGTYLVMVYFLTLPLIERPRAWMNLLGIAFCFCNLVTFWTSIPRALRLTLAGLDALVAVAVIAAAMVTVSLGRPMFLDDLNVVPLVVYFGVFVPFLAAGYLWRGEVRHGL